MTYTLHESRSDLWMTPEHIIDRARHTLGRIDLDVASSAEANERVHAARFITREEDALSVPWDCENQSVFCNPPGGRHGSTSLPQVFWQRLLEHRGRMAHAIFIGFNLECVRTTQLLKCPSVLEFPFCVPRQRLRFHLPTHVGKDRPRYANVIVYVPGRLNLSMSFKSNFTDIGLVRI